MDLKQLLSSLQAPDENIRRQATLHLQEFEEKQFEQFALALCNGLATESTDTHFRQSAGLLFKNMIYKKNELHRDKWINVPDNSKEQMRQLLSNALFSTQKEVSHTAAQAVATVAAVDIPINQWPVLIPALLNNMSKPEISDLVKKSSVQALGYMCNEIPDSSRLREDIVDQILTTIVQGISNSSMDVSSAAVQALKDALQFAKKNFDVPQERDAIMTAICNAASTTTNDVMRETAYQCLVEVADCYVTKLHPYVQNIFQLQVAALDGTINEDIQNLAFEFWDVICIGEKSLQDDEDEVLNIAGLITPQFAQQLIPYIKKSIVTLDCDENDEESIYKNNIDNKSVYNLMENLSKMLGDKFGQIMMEFVTQSIQNPDWRYRHGALSAYIATIAGASPQMMKPIIESTPTVLINMMKKEVLQVRDVAFLSMCTTFREGYVDSLNVETCDALIKTVLESMQEDYELIVIAACELAKEFSKAFSNVAENPTNPLSRYAKEILTSLVNISKLKPNEEIQRRAYDAQIAVVENTAEDCYQLIDTLLVETVGRLDATLQTQAQQAQQNANYIDQHLNDVQSLLVGVLNISLRKLPRNMLENKEDVIMGHLFRILSGGKQTLSSHEEAFMAIGHFAEKVSSFFTRYEEVYKQFLVAAINSDTNEQEINFPRDYPDISIQAIGSLSDVCKAKTNQIHKYCDDIINLLLHLLHSGSAKRKVKSHAISVFADIAMADEDLINDKKLPGCPSESKIVDIFSILRSAGQSIIGTDNDDDEDEIQFSTELRESILGAYSGILLSLVDKKAILSEIDFIVAFAADCNKFAQNNYTDDSATVIEKVVLLLGDLSDQLGADNMAKYLRNDAVKNLLREAEQDDDMKESALWARKAIFGQ